MTKKGSGQGHKQIKWLLVLCLLSSGVALLAGCWDARPLEDRATLLAIAIDKVDPEEAREQADVTHSSGKDPVAQKTGIRLTAQIAVPGRLPLGATQGGSSTEQSPVWIVSVVSHTLESAFKDIQQEISDKLFLGHLRVVIVSEELARGGLHDLRDYMRREPQVRRTVRLAVSEGEAAKFMQASPPLERVPALYLTAMLENATKLGKFPSMSLGKFWSYNSAQGREPFLSYLKVEKNRDIKVKGLAYFRGDKMVGATKAREIDYYMGIMGIPYGGYPFLSPLPESGKDGYYTLDVTDRRAIRKIEIKNGRPHVTLRIFIEGNIGEIAGEPLTESLMRKMEKQNEAEGERNVLALIKRTQKQRSDIFAFGEYVRGKFPKYWNEHVRTIDRWREIYKELPVEIKVKLKIRRIGAKDN